MSLSVEKMHILRHSLGIEYKEQGARPYRNRYATEATSTEGVLCEELVRDGYMTTGGPRDILGGMSLYFVTDKGIDAARDPSL